MRRALLVAARELQVTLRRKSYLFATFGTPVVFGLIFAVIAFLTAQSASKVTPKNVAVADSSGVLDLQVLQAMQSDTARYGGLAAQTRAEMDRMMEGLPASVRSITSRSFEGMFGSVNLSIVTNADSARSAVRREELDALFTVAPDYLGSGRVTLYSKGGSIFDEGEDGGGRAGRMLREALLRSLMRREAVEEAIQPRLMDPMRLQQFELRQAGGEAGTFEERGVGTALRSFGFPYAFGLLMLMSIMMTGSFLLQGVAEEKENRVIEILLSTTTTDQIILGKVLGLGAAGILQMVVWLGMGAAILLYGGGFIPQISVPWGLFFLALGYFVFGYLLVSSVMGGVGSLMNSYREAQQFSSWFVFPVVLPLILMMPILTEPNGVLARVLSYIPFTTPITMMIRLPTEQVPWWEVPITFLVLAAGSWLAIKAGAKLFRLGSLMYGKRPTFPEIWKWLWQSA